MTREKQRHLRIMPLRVFMPIFMVGSLCVVAGCYTNRVHGVLPRTGELFMSTRAPLKENNGVPVFLAAAWEAPTVIIPLMCAPVALGVGILDQCVCSPVWDVLCIPADLAIPTAKMKIVNTAGEPVTNSYVNCAGRHEADKDAVIQFKLMRMLGDPASISVQAPGYAYNTFSVPRDNKEHIYVLLTQEELVKKRREDDIRKREEQKRRSEEMELECAKRDNNLRKYWALILQGPLERLKKAEFHYDDLRSEDFKTETRALSDCKNYISSENLDHLFSLMERRPDLAHEWGFLYGARAVQAERLEANRAFALKLAEDKKTTRPLLAVLYRCSTPEEYGRMAMENPKLDYCRKEIEDRVRKMQKWREYWDQEKKKKQEVRSRGEEEVLK